MTLVDDATAKRVASLIDTLALAGLTMSTAESLTGGLLHATLIHPAGASRVMRGGIIAYSNDAKREVLEVPESLLAERGAVDPDVAVAMATGALRALSSSLALSTTGVAGPETQDGIESGTAFVALDFADGREAVVTRLEIGGDRDTVRWGVVVAALELLENSLRKE